MTSAANIAVSPKPNSTSLLPTDVTIKGLKDSSSSPTASSADNIVWKDLGVYLESLNEIDSAETSSKLKNSCKIDKPLSASFKFRVCNICNRPILLSHLTTHIQACLEMRQSREKPVSVEVEDEKGSSTPASTANNSTKKRKNDDSTPVLKKKAKASSSTPKSSAGSTVTKKRNGKQKGPVDVEKQCGVALADGGFCARSLTCKTHSMGAKRAVPGRSAAYDVLLAAYQHKNQVKIAGQAAKLQAEKDELIHGGETALDSDEETQQVLSGVSRSFPLPLERNNLVPTRIRTNFLRMREMFAGAILPRITNSNGVGGINGRTALLDIDRSTEHLFLVRAPQRIMLNKNNIAQQQAQQPQQQAHPQVPPQQLTQQQRNAILAQRAQQLQQAQAQQR